MFLMKGIRERRGVEVMSASSSISTWNSTRATPVDGWHCACGEGNAFAQSGRMLESANTAHVSTPAADVMFTSTVLVICWPPTNGCTGIGNNCWNFWFFRDVFQTTQRNPPEIQAWRLVHPRPQHAPAASAKIFNTFRKVKIVLTLRGSGREKNNRFSLLRVLRAQERAKHEPALILSLDLDGTFSHELGYGTYKALDIVSITEVGEKVAQRRNN